jgi:hypothetical protein
MGAEKESLLHPSSSGTKHTTERSKSCYVLLISSALVAQEGLQIDHMVLIMRFMSAVLLGSGSAMALSVSTCLIRHMDFFT